MLTSNKGFEEWGQILGDEVMAAALLDRILHRCHIVNIRGNSYRLLQGIQTQGRGRQDRAHRAPCGDEQGDLSG